MFFTVVKRQDKNEEHNTTSPVEVHFIETNYFQVQGKPSVSETY